MTRPLSYAPGSADVVFDGVYVVLDRDDLYPVLRDDLYLFLAFLLASGIFMLLTYRVPRCENRPAGRGAREPRRRTPGRSRRESPSIPPRAHGRSLASPVTGLVWAEHLPPRLKAEIGRAAAADQDLSFARIVLDLPPGSPGAAAAAAEVARQLSSSFPVADLLFESGPGSFSVILPDQDLDLAVRNLEALRAGVASAAAARCTVSVGVSARGGRLIEENTLLVEAEIASSRATREGGNQVVGFRADPARSSGPRSEGCRPPVSILVRQGHVLQVPAEECLGEDVLRLGEQRLQLPLGVPRAVVDQAELVHARVARDAGRLRRGQVALLRRRLRERFVEHAFADEQVRSPREVRQPGSRHRVGGEAELAAPAAVAEHLARQHGRARRQG